MTIEPILGVDADPTAQGRIKGAKPVAVLDIGSNSVRLVVYERLARSLTPLYNEKIGLRARGAASAEPARLAYENIDRALTAIQRFALVARLMKVGKVISLATSAVREASNSKAFVDAVEETMGARCEVLERARRRRTSPALGVRRRHSRASSASSATWAVAASNCSAINAAAAMRSSETHELGVIRVQDDSGNDPLPRRRRWPSGG